MARLAYRFLALPLALMALFFFYPLVQAFWMSLWDYQHSLFHPGFVGLSNYLQLFHSGGFLNALSNTAWFLLLVVPAMVVIPIAMAVMLNGNLKGASLFRTLIYLPVVISFVVAGIIWKWLYAEEGLINYGLSVIGIDPVGWLIQPDVALFAVAVVVVWKGLAYYMMMYLSQLQSLSQELYEAANVDGASVWQKHWHITVPHLAPTMAMVGLISTIGTLKLFTEVYVMTRGGPLDATETLVYYIYERAFENLDLGLACAAGMVLMLLLLAVSILQLRYFGDADALAELKTARPAPAKAAV